MEDSKYMREINDIMLFFIEIYSEEERIDVFVVYNLLNTMSKLATFHLFRAATDDCFVT